MEIMHIQDGRKVLSSVPGTPPGEAWVYQMGVPLQLSATEAGLFCCIRRGGVKAVDFEVGNDLIPFDSIDRIEAERAVPLVRGTSMRHPETGEEQVLSVYPITGGFVPLGATLHGGRIHPHAGTGFGVCQMLGYPPDLSREPGRTDRPIKLMRSKNVVASVKETALLSSQRQASAPGAARRMQGVTFECEDAVHQNRYECMPFRYLHIRPVMGLKRNSVGLVHNYSREIGSFVLVYQCEQCRLIA